MRLAPTSILFFVLSSTLAQAQVPPPAEAAAEAEAPVSPAIDSDAQEARVREQMRALTEPGGLTSDQAAERAVATAPSLQRAAAVVAVAEAGARRAWQGFFPRLEVSARYTRLSPIDQPSFGGALLDEDQVAAANMLVAGVDDTEARILWQQLIDTFGNSDSAFEFPVILNQYVFRATATLPVSDIFLTILPGYRAARAAVEVTEAQRQADQLQIAQRAREAYYQLARARGAEVIATKAVEQAEAHRTRVGTLVEAGAAAPVDLLRVEAQVAQARVAAVRAQSGARIAERALQLLMHEDEPIALGESLEVREDSAPGDVDALTQQALRDRAEMQTLRRLVEAREAAVRSTLGRRWPQLFVQGNVDIANPNQRIIPQVEEFRTTWDVSVVLRWSPNEMGEARVQAAEARAQIEQTRADMANLSDAVRLEVAEAHSSLSAARLAYEAARVGLAAAEAEHQVRFAQLEAGAAVTSDLLDAEADLTRARLQLVDAAIELRLSTARLRYSVGR